MEEYLSDFHELGDLREDARRFLLDPGRTTIKDLFRKAERVFRNHKTNFPAADLLDIMEGFELGAGKLLGRHRLHYFHVFYVWLLGLCIYHRNPTVRTAVNGWIQKEYGPEDRRDLLAGIQDVDLFLYEWTLAGIFHDIAYPFEISLKAINKFFADATGESRERVFVRAVVDDLDGLLKLRELGGAGTERPARDAAPPKALDLISENLAAALGAGGKDAMRALIERYLDEGLKKGFADHGVFGAAIVLSRVNEYYGRHGSEPTTFYRSVVNAASAILLHNAFPYVLRKKMDFPPLRLSAHPIAFLLILCDNLQEWAKYESRQAEYITDEDVELELMRYDLDVDEGGVLLRTPPTKGPRGPGGRRASFPEELRRFLTDTLDFETLDGATPLKINLALKDNRPIFASWVLATLDEKKAGLPAECAADVEEIAGHLLNAADRMPDYLERYLGILEGWVDSPYPELRRLAGHLIGKLEYFNEFAEDNASRLLEALKILAKDPFPDVWTAGVLAMERMAFVPEIRAYIPLREPGPDSAPGGWGDFCTANRMAGWPRRQRVALAQRVRRVVHSHDPIIREAETFIRSPSNDVHVVRTILRTFPWLFRHQAARIDLAYWCQLIHIRSLEERGEQVLARELLDTLAEIIGVYPARADRIAHRSRLTREELLGKVVALADRGRRVLDNPPAAIGPLWIEDGQGQADPPEGAGPSPGFWSIQRARFHLAAGRYVGALLRAAETGGLGLDIALVRRCLSVVDRESGSMSAMLPDLVEGARYARRLGAGKGAGCEEIGQIVEDAVRAQLAPGRMSGRPSFTQRQVLRLAARILETRSADDPGVNLARDTLAEALGCGRTFLPTVRLAAADLVLGLPEKERKEFGVPPEPPDPEAVADEIVRLWRDCQPGSAERTRLVLEMDYLATRSFVPPGVLDRAGSVEERRAIGREAKNAHGRSLARMSRAALEPVSTEEAESLWNWLWRYADQCPEEAFELGLRILEGGSMLSASGIENGLFSFLDGAMHRLERIPEPGGPAEGRWKRFARVHRIQASGGAAKTLKRIRGRFETLSRSSELRAYAAALGRFEADPIAFCRRREAPGYVRQMAADRHHGRHILGKTFPELIPLIGLSQGKFHDVDAFEHTLRVMEGVDAVLDDFRIAFPNGPFPQDGPGSAGAPPASRAEFIQRLYGIDEGPESNVRLTSEEVQAGEERRGRLRLAALFHDIGKPLIDNNGKPAEGVRFIGHEQAGAAVFREVAKRLRIPRPSADGIASLIEHHGRVLSLMNAVSGSLDEGSAKKSGGVRVGRAIDRFLRGTDADILDLLALFQADVGASAAGRDPEEREKAVKFCRLVLDRREAADREASAGSEEVLQGQTAVPE
jgi:hypothetical protein